jgi:hypothetical protein
LESASSIAILLHHLLISDNLLSHEMPNEKGFWAVKAVSRQATL